MQKDYKNKQMTGKDAENKAATTAPQELYHFAGSGEYQPIAIMASSPAEAEKTWEEKRVPIQK